MEIEKKGFNWKKLSVTYSAYGEHYTAIQSIYMWVSLILMILGGALVVKYSWVDDYNYKMLFIVVGMLYIASIVFTNIYVSVLRKRLKELLKK